MVASEHGFELWGNIKLTFYFFSGERACFGKIQARALLGFLYFARI
jgi:hypothetical protein